MQLPAVFLRLVEKRGCEKFKQVIAVEYMYFVLGCCRYDESTFFRKHMWRSVRPFGMDDCRIAHKAIVAGIGAE